jgi:cytochrome c-type biogenesis protein CcmH/NrfG
MSDFNPNSPDAVFSRILAKLEEQNRSASETRSEFLAILTEIRAEVKKTNGRVSAIERWRAEIKGKTAMLATAVSAAVGLGAWLVERLWP